MAASESTIRNLLGNFGANVAEVTMMIPYMFFTPASSDPDMQAVMKIVRGLQGGLSARGYDVGALDGKLGAKTAATLNAIISPKNAYVEKTWLEIYSIVSRVPARSSLQRERKSLPGTLPGEAPPSVQAGISPLLIAGAAFVGLWLFMGKKKGKR